MENQLNGASTSTSKRPTTSGAKAAAARSSAMDGQTSEVKSLSDVRSLTDVQAFAEGILSQNFGDVDEVKAQIRKSVDELEVRAKEYSKTAVTYVKRNPGLFAAIAAGITLWFVSSFFRGNDKRA